MTGAVNKNCDLVLAGRPFAPSGRGEDVRTLYRAFRAIGFNASMLDLYMYSFEAQDSDIRKELSRGLVDKLSAGVNIFCMNGDEIVQIAEHWFKDIDPHSYNVMYPAWELSKYPEEWANLIEKYFDEVWANSGFVADAISKSVSKPVFCLPAPSEVGITSFLGRRHFGIPESPYVFLFFFEFTSFIDRKNPSAVLKAFEKLSEKAGKENARLVLKLSGAERRPNDFKRFEEMLNAYKFKDRVVVINRTLSNNEIGNLMRCADCFISLHRSEGYGRGLSEAMYLGKPVIATGYSGNLEFMDDSNSCLVKYDLIPVMEGQYPHAKGQVWADPDPEHAAEYMLKLLSDREWGRKLGAAASRHIRTHYSYKAKGLQYLERVQSINEMRSGKLAHL